MGPVGVGEGGGTGSHHPGTCPRYGHRVSQGQLQTLPGRPLCGGVVPTWCIGEGREAGQGCWRPRSPLPPGLYQPPWSQTLPQLHSGAMWEGQQGPRLGLPRWQLSSGPAALVPSPCPGAASSVVAVGPHAYPPIAVQCLCVLGRLQAGPAPGQPCHQPRPGQARAASCTGLVDLGCCRAAATLSQYRAEPLSPGELHPPIGRQAAAEPSTSHGRGTVHKHRATGYGLARAPGITAGDCAQAPEPRQGTVHKHLGLWNFSAGIVG